MRVLRALCAGVAAVCMLTGCALFHHRSLALACSERPFQGSSDPGVPLVVPEGMSPPETRNNIKIPALNEAEAPRPRGEPCLAMPPSFAGGEAEGVRTRVVPASAAPTQKLPLPPPQ
ncbi:MAG: hypothetical protein ABSG12_02165 [Steroidobacteraceae bacterium]